MISKKSKCAQNSIYLKVVPSPQVRPKSLLFGLSTFFFLVSSTKCKCTQNLFCMEVVRQKSHLFVASTKCAQNPFCLEVVHQKSHLFLASTKSKCAQNPFCLEVVHQKSHLFVASTKSKCAQIPFYLEVVRQKSHLFLTSNTSEGGFAPLQIVFTLLDPVYVGVARSLIENTNC